MNKERMFELADLIENADKDQFHLGSWFGYRDPESGYWNSESTYFGKIGNYFSQGPNELTCGTTACVAGWAVAMKYSFDTSLYLDTVSIQDTATDYLDLTTGQADRLFFAGPNSVWARYENEYSYSVTERMEEDGEVIIGQLDPEFWNVTNKDAADILRRIAKEEIYL